MFRIISPSGDRTTQNRRHRLTIRLWVLLIGALIYPQTAAHADNGVSVICDGSPMQVSLELYYRLPQSSGPGAFRSPDLHLASELNSCSLEALYQELVDQPDLVLHHATGERPFTALTRIDNAAAWDKTDNFQAIKLRDGMRIWITLFNEPTVQPFQNEA